MVLPAQPALSLIHIYPALQVNFAIIGALMVLTPGVALTTVSYTHLDVYKRQQLPSAQER